MTTDGMSRPFVVAAWFGDPASGYLMTAAQSAPSAGHAIALAVSQYYMSGGKLPVVATNAMEISRETLSIGIAMLDAIEQRQQEEQAKVVSIVAAPPPEGAA